MLDLSLTEPTIAWAVAALAADEDSPTIRILAGLSANDAREEVAPYPFRPFESNLGRLEAQLFRELGRGAVGRFGGGAACERLTGHFRGDRTVVYVTSWPGSDFVAKARLIPDPAGTVSFSLSPGPLAFESPEAQTVHPLLAYAELLTDPDERAHEGAAEIYERLLAKAFEPR